MFNGKLFPENKVLLEISLDRNALLRDLARASREIKKIKNSCRADKGRCRKRIDAILDDIWKVRKERYLTNIDEKLSGFRTGGRCGARDDRLDKDSVLARSFLLCKVKQRRFQRKINGLNRKYGSILNFNMDVSR